MIAYPDVARLLVMPLPRDPEKARLARERMRRSHLGKKLPPEQKAKIAASVSRAKKGVPRPDMRGDGNPMRRPEVAAKFKGHRNPRYVAVPAYEGLHDRLVAQLGQPSSCEVCGEPANHWALSHEAPLIEIDNRGRRYSLDLDDYIEMCHSCHIRYDRGTLSI
jgi:hypothetical protein